MKRLTRAVRRSLLRLAVLLILAVALALTPSVVAGWRMYRTAIEQLPPQQAAQQMSQQPGYTPLAELPPLYVKAVLAAEDHRFYDHHGFDPISTLRAVWANLNSRSYAQGGSTITQQLAKNLYYTHEKKFERKFAELFTAILLEKTLTKDQILELYVNGIYFGAGYYGIGEAARGFFGVDPANLTDAQCVVLAGLPKAPSSFDPTGGNTGPALQRQQQVLRRKVAPGVLTQAEADAIAAQPVFGAAN